MILTRTPLRISLFGGGSDIQSFYKDEPGMVLSTTIDKYMYIALCKTAFDGIKIVYNEIELAPELKFVKHSRVRESLLVFDINSHIEISSFCEIPTKGTGLGSSSTFTVGLINALSKLKGYSLNKYELAEAACKIEIDMCNEPIGKQDQYAAAFGGFNSIKFYEDKVHVHKPRVSSLTLNNLNSNLMMFYTGITRNTSDILREQSKNDNRLTLRKMVELAKEAELCLENDSIDDIGYMLHEAWNLKRNLANNISSYFIDQYYDTAIRAGALGGKVLGAGGGGYLLFYVPQHKQEAVKASLSDLKQFDFKFEDTGTTVVYDESKRAF